MPLQYRDKIAIEQLRSVEQHSQAITIREQPASSFEQFLHQRVKQVELQPSWRDIFIQPQRWYRTIGYSACLLACLVGVVAVIKALAGPDTLNVFWVLIVLLGFNVLSFVLWLVFTYIFQVPARSPLVSMFLQALHWGIKLAAKGSPAQFSSKAWLNIQLSEPQGKWFVSSLVHAIWLSYLMGGFVALLLVLMTRQYDFIWGSTLLSQVAFEQLTVYLSLPMNWINWPVPSIDEVASSQQGLNTMSAQLRSSWAYFLLGCLLFYGVIPRLLALLGCYGLRMYQLQHIFLDYDDAYYVKLKRQWQPPSSATKIIDADNLTPGIKSTSFSGSLVQYLPATALWVGVELPRHIVETNPGLTLQVNVVDKNSAAKAADMINNNQAATVFVLCAQKPPDRGIHRLLQELILIDKQYWLVCLGNSEKDSDIFSLWQAEANILNIPAEHCMLMSNVEAGMDG